MARNTGMPFANLMGVEIIDPSKDRVIGKLLVRADLHREGLLFPVAPHRGYLETEGLAVLARDMG